MIINNNVLRGVILSVSEESQKSKFATRPFTTFRVTIQTADIGSSETADPYDETRPYTQGEKDNVILSEAKNLNYALCITLYNYTSSIDSFQVGKGFC